MTKKKLKGMKFFIAIVVVVALLLGVASLVFNPFVKNLGISWDEETAQSANAKLMRERIALVDTNNPLDSVKYEGSHKVDDSLTSEELTAIINTRDYKYNPVKNVQIRVNDDGTTEVSGIILLVNIIPYTEAFGIRNAGVKDAISKFGEKLPINPSFYVKGTPKIVNNVANIEVEEIKVGVFNVGDKLKDGALNEAVNQQISGVPGFEVEELGVSDGKLDFKGSYPDKSYYSPN